jgi:hypothetical protein
MNRRGRVGKSRVGEPLEVTAIHVAFYPWYPCTLVIASAALERCFMGAKDRQHERFGFGFSRGVCTIPGSLRINIRKNW